MQNTTNYNFNLPEGTDLWNYLTQTNPNFTALDTILKSVSDATVTTATEVTSGTAHAVTRTLPDANVIRFTATGVWTLGDTMTIDGTPVTVVKPNGTSLQTGDYIIGSEVLGVLRSTQFTVYVGGGSSTMDAEDVDYDNSVSGLTATDVQSAIDEEASAINAINSNLSKHTLGTIVDITSHNSLNPYICPSDGYIRVTSGGVGGEQYALMDGVALAMVIGTSTEPTCRLSVFVRKGSAISTQSNSISGTGEFIPLD